MSTENGAPQAVRADAPTTPSTKQQVVTGNVGFSGREMVQQAPIILDSQRVSSLSRPASGAVTAQNTLLAAMAKDAGPNVVSVGQARSADRRSPPRMDNLGGGFAITAKGSSLMPAPPPPEAASSRTVETSAKAESAPKVTTAVAASSSTAANKDAAALAKDPSEKEGEEDEEDEDGGKVAAAVAPVLNTNPLPELPKSIVNMDPMESFVFQYGS